MAETYGYFFDVGSAREFSESTSKQQEALSILRHRKLTKLSFERDIAKDGCRLAPSIDILRNGWGFDILGTGTIDDPYWMPNPMQHPQKVKTTEEIKGLYWESDHWKRIREQRWKHDYYRCVLCVGSCRSSLQCHHITYNLFNEKLDELMTVCEEHHEKIHASCYLKFPTGVETWVAERILGVITYPFEEWLLP